MPATTWPGCWRAAGDRAGGLARPLGGRREAPSRPTPQALCAALLRAIGRHGAWSPTRSAWRCTPRPSRDAASSDALGAVNHAVSGVADRAYLVVAGRAARAPAARAAAVRRGAVVPDRARAGPPSPTSARCRGSPLVGHRRRRGRRHVWWLAGRVWPAAVAAVVAVAVDAAVTGCLHLDGLADAADGLLPAVGRARRFEIMADPRVGAFGAVALVLVLSLRVTALAATVGPPVGGRRAVVRVAHHDGRGGALACPTRTRTGARPRPSWAPERHSAASRYGVAAYGMARRLRVRRRRRGGRGLVVVGAEVVAMLAVVWFAGAPDRRLHRRRARGDGGHR